VLGGGVAAATLLHSARFLLDGRRVRMQRGRGSGAGGPLGGRLGLNQPDDLLDLVKVRVRVRVRVR
jgi:hypothetical protein